MRWGWLVVACSAVVLAACVSNRAPSRAQAQRPAAASSWRELAPDPAQPEVAPRARTPDGKQVRVRSVEVRAIVIPPLAFTELELELDALPAESATLEVSLPPGAAVSRFAVREGERWQEAKLVDSSRAEAELGGKRAAEGPRSELPGETFRARLLKRERGPRVLLGYAEVMTSAEAPYRVRVAGLQRLERLRAVVEVRGPRPARHELDRAELAPERDFVLEAPALGWGDGAAALRAGPYVVMRIPPPTTSSDELTFLVDTSQSQPLALAEVSRRLLALSEELAKRRPGLQLNVVAFDQDIQPLLVRAVAPLREAQLAPLRDRGQLGATDLTFAVSGTIAQGLPHRHLVMISDFENTLRPVGNAFNIGHSQLARWDHLPTDAASERKLLEKRREYGGWSEYPGVVARFDLDAAELAERLLQPTPEVASLDIAGADWSVGKVEKQRLGIGETMIVLAELDAQKPLRVQLNERFLSVPEPSVDDTLTQLLERVVGRVRLHSRDADWSDRRGEADEQSAAIDLASATKKYRIIGPESAFLVRGHDSRPLAGRSVAPPLPPGVTRGIMRESPKPEPPNDRCPDLVGDARAGMAGKGCPPLVLDLSQERPRVLARVAFRGGSAAPDVAASPHLPQLYDLLDVRRELAKVEVSTTNGARSAAVVRYLVSRGIAAERLSAAVLPGPPPKRKLSPDCKTPGDDVVLEVRAAQVLPGVPAPQAATTTPSKPAMSRGARLSEAVQNAWKSESSDAKLAQALDETKRWLAAEPNNPVAHVLLGDISSKQRDDTDAARAYGSLFDLSATGVGLSVAAGIRLQQLAQPRGKQDHDGGGPFRQRLWDLVNEWNRQSWQDHRERIEAVRARGYAALRDGDFQKAFGQMHEAAKFSQLVELLELPVLAQHYLANERKASSLLEVMLPQECRFPLRANVLGAVLSWEDVESELEVRVTSVEKGTAYDSVYQERGSAAALKWIPLPQDDDAYPVQISVRAERLSKHGYAFGVLRKLDTFGKGRLEVEERPFVLSQVGESVVVLEETILQRPQ